MIVGYNANDCEATVHISKHIINKLYDQIKMSVVVTAADELLEALEETAALGLGEFGAARLQLERERRRVLALRLRPMRGIVIVIGERCQTMPHGS